MRTRPAHRWYKQPVKPSRGPPGHTCGFVEVRFLCLLLLRVESSNTICVGEPRCLSEVTWWSKPRRRQPVLRHWWCWCYWGLQPYHQFGECLLFGSWVNNVFKRNSSMLFLEIEERYENFVQSKFFYFELSPNVPLFYFTSWVLIRPKRCSVAVWQLIFQAIIVDIQRSQTHAQYASDWPTC